MWFTFDGMALHIALLGSNVVYRNVDILMKLLLILRLRFCFKIRKALFDVSRSCYKTKIAA